MAASWCQPLQLSSLPRGARMIRRPLITCRTYPNELVRPRGRCRRTTDDRRVRGGAICRTSLKARSTPLPAFSGRRCSSASAAASNSIAKRFSARSTMDRNFSALVIPIETWSSFPPDVLTLSMLAGCASTRASLRRDAATTCGIMKPDSKPGCRARNAGKPFALVRIHQSIECVVR